MQIHEITLTEVADTSDPWQQKLAQAQHQGYGMGSTGTAAALWLAKKLRPNKPATTTATGKTDISPQPSSTPTTGVAVNPGQRLTIAIQTAGAQAPTYYYKTSAGWTNEIGQKIVNPDSIANLEARADAGSGRLENIPRTPKINKKSNKQ